MAHISAKAAEGIGQGLQPYQDQRALRIIVCGGDDDGKGTFLERLRFESTLPSGNQPSQSKPDLKFAGTPGGNLGFAHLMDGLATERAEDSDLGPAYSFFSTVKRDFIVADVSDHGQYMRNMVVGASAADLAIILVDAEKDAGLTQTRRLVYLGALMGIRHVVLAIDKLDCVENSQAVFDRIDAEYRAFAKEVGLKEIISIPTLVLKGDNISGISSNTSWYPGPGLMEYLETVQVDDIEPDTCPFRMQALWVDAPERNLHGYSGIVVGGSVRPGDRVRVLPSGRESTVAHIMAGEGELARAAAGQSITVVLNDEVNISGGTVLATADAPPGMSDQFEVSMVWMVEEPMMPGRNYLLKIGTQTVTATFATPKYKIDVITLDHIAARTLEVNDVGVCNVSLDQQIVFDPYELNRDMGGFVLVDRISNDTVGVGIIHFALRRAENIHWQAIDINKNAHASLKGQKPCVLWFTGLSGSGKSTVANVVEKKLHAMGKHTYLLDGDNVRHGLNKDLGFTEADRVENIRRVGEVARLMVDAGLIVLVSFISPFRSERRMSRELVGADEFYEIYVDTSIEVAEARDPKGLYKKARSGNLKNFTGIDSPYEVPENPEIRIDTTQIMPEQAAEIIVSHLISSGNLSS